MKKEQKYACSFEKEKITHVLTKAGQALFTKGLKYTFNAVFNKFYKKLISPFLFLRAKKYFIFEKKRLVYFYRGGSAFTERAIEIPLANYFFKKNKNIRILEIGNVMNQYKKYNSTVVDKYALVEGVLNEDIVCYKPETKYDIIISISTLEHVGWDEIPKESKKFSNAIKNIKKNCLKKNGKLIFTVPLGYNTYMDRILKNNKINFYKKYFFKRISLNNQWALADEKEAFSKKYNFPYECANAIMLGILKK